jgi:SAM-dependent methyltransferase
MQAARTEHWSAGAHYEPYVGRWSRRVADEFVRWLARPPGCDWLDVGCGTGALSSTIVVLARPRKVHAVDSSDAFLDYARHQVDDPSVEFHLGDARALPLDDSCVDVAVSGLVLNFIVPPEDAVREMVRVTRPGGTLAAYVWDYAERMQLMRLFWDAVVALDPAAAALDEGRRFPLCKPEPLQQLFSAAGLRAVSVRAVDVETNFESFDAYWAPFLGGQGPAPGYAMALAEERRSALRERLRALVPAASDGSIRLVARAWAVRGERP